MNTEKAIKLLREMQEAWKLQITGDAFDALEMAIAALDQLDNNSTKPDNSTATQSNGIESKVKGLTACRVPEDDTISRTDAVEMIESTTWHDPRDTDVAHEVIGALPSAQPDLGKYEYHYDHTDCIWYRPEARNRCPVTCAQYRDGWNDAMNYIFRDGKGYRPYRRDEKYE